VQYTALPEQLRSNIRRMALAVQGLNPSSIPRHSFEPLFRKKHIEQRMHSDADWGSVTTLTT